jgi:hypothetical protein
MRSTGQARKLKKHTKKPSEKEKAHRDGFGEREFFMHFLDNLAVNK